MNQIAVAVQRRYPFLSSDYTYQATYHIALDVCRRYIVAPAVEAKSVFDESTAIDPSQTSLHNHQMVNSILRPRVLLAHRRSQSSSVAASEDVSD